MKGKGIDKIRNRIMPTDKLPDKLPSLVDGRNDLNLESQSDSTALQCF